MTDIATVDVRGELPEIEQLDDAATRAAVVEVWESFLAESTYETITSAPALRGVSGYDLAAHTRHVAQNALALAERMAHFQAIDYDRDDLLAAALTHDASKLVEMQGPEGERTELGKALLHAQIAGVRCLERGLSHKVAYIVSYHPYTPPHVHIKPQCVEMILLSWADIMAVDAIFFSQGFPTHLDIGKRFFTLAD
jgi:HD domain